MKRLVEKLGLSQAAKKLDVGKSTLYRYVNNIIKKIVFRSQSCCA
ncbi:MAG: helix-turn-helix domain-containing protein [Sulfolobales archaeon]|nr:helix-turn-helix domain-containing protein [Sulfolobales archaeon]